MTHPPTRSPTYYGRSPFRALPLTRIAAWALGLNAAWEFMQCTLLYDMSSWSFSRAALWMWGAILGDVLIVMGVAYVALTISGLRRLLPLNLKRSTALSTIGLAGGVFLEWVARILDLWDYTAAMPTVALFGHAVGLSPVLQITVLPTLSVYLAGRTETNTFATMC